MKREKKINIIMQVLFVLTIMSFFGAFISWCIYNESNANVGMFAFAKTTWVCWLWIPIPLLSIVLGYKFKKIELKYKKNVIIGYIVFILLLLYGSFWLFTPNYSHNYEEIFRYNGIMNIKLPTNGKLEIIKWNDSQDQMKFNYESIYAYYNNKNTNDIVKSIKNNNHWIISNEIDPNLIFLIPGKYRQRKNVYLSIYNSTLNNYNSPITTPGKYQLYIMIYDIPSKLLQVDKFIYFYK